MSMTIVKITREGIVVPTLNLVAATKSAKRGDKKGHPFRGNRYTGGIKRDNGEGAM
jgi:hypothetical protein